MNTENAETDKFQEEAIAPMHTAEHLLNRTMVNKFRCERSRNAHIERKQNHLHPACLPFRNRTGGSGGNNEPTDKRRPARC